MLHTTATPKRLANIPDKPYRLHIKGAYNEHLPAIAIVGSRNCTTEGEQTAKQLASMLAREGIAIISGLARGIDKAAHKGALEARGITYAVLPSGINTIYPNSHRALANKILDSGGAIISERPGSYMPKKYDFLGRNRIISGLADYVVIVEAAKRSGALNTARHALEQNRELIAVPGSIYANQSAGTNDLIRQGATPLTSIDEIINIIGLKPKIEKSHLLLSKDEKTLIKLLSDGPKTQDYINNVSSLGIENITAIISKLEIEGVIDRAPGNYIYKRY